MPLQQIKLVYLSPLSVRLSVRRPLRGEQSEPNRQSVRPSVRHHQFTKGTLAVGYPGRKHCQTDADGGGRTQTA